MMLLDLHLSGGVSGMDILKKAVVLKPDVRIAILTGFGTDANVRDECLNSGAKLFLEKPIRLANLLEELDKLSQL
ncbi:MAG: response regulator [Candidatus Omnitrophota bacterium]